MKFTGDIAHKSLTQIEKHIASQSPFVFSAQVLLSTGKLPKKEVLFGLNKDEGTYFLVYGLPGFNVPGESLITRNEFLKGVAIVMANASNLTRDAAIFQYTEWTDENNRMKNRDLLGSLVGDRMFVCPLLEFAHR